MKWFLLRFFKKSLKIQNQQNNVRVKKATPKETSTSAAYRQTGETNVAFLRPPKSSLKTKEILLELNNVSDSGYSGRSTTESYDKSDESLQFKPLEHGTKFWLISRGSLFSMSRMSDYTNLNPATESAEYCFIQIHVDFIYLN